MKALRNIALRTGLSLMALGLTTSASAGTIVTLIQGTIDPGSFGAGNAMSAAFFVDFDPYNPNIDQQTGNGVVGSIRASVDDPAVQASNLTIGGAPFSNRFAVNSSQSQVATYENVSCLGASCYDQIDRSFFTSTFYDTPKLLFERFFMLDFNIITLAELGNIGDNFTDTIDTDVGFLSTGPGHFHYGQLIYTKPGFVYDDDELEFISQNQFGREANFHISHFTSYYEGNAIPEPASWALMIAGFGLVGGALRRGNGRRRPAMRVTCA